MGGEAQQGSLSPAGLRVALGWILDSACTPGTWVFFLPCPPKKEMYKSLWREWFDLFIVFLAGIKFNVWKGFM